MADVNLKVSAGVEPGDIKSMQDLLSVLKDISNEQKRQQQSSGGLLDNESISEQRRLISQLSKQLEDLKKKVDDVNKGRREEIGIINNLNKQIAELSKKRNEATSTKEIKAYNAELKKLQAEQQKLLNASGGKGLLDSIMNGVGLGAGLGAVALIGQAVSYIKTFAVESFKASANFEQLKIAFGTMLGSNVKATELLNGITKFASDTPYAVDQLTDLSKQLLAFGYEADEIIPTLNMLGNVSAGVGKDKMPQLILAMGQIRSAGKLMGQDLLQLINAGFNPLQVISEKTGESMTALKGRMSKGLVTFKEVEGAFKMATSEGGKFYNLMQAQTNTVAGQIDRLGDAFTQLQVAVGSNLQQPVGAMVGLLSELVEMTTDYIGLKPSEELEKQRVAFNVLVTELIRNNDNQSRRNQLIAEINNKYPEYVKNINLEKASQSELLGMLNGVNGALTTKIRLMAREEEYQTKLNKATKAQQRLNDKSNEFTEFLLKNTNLSQDRVAQYLNDLEKGRKTASDIEDALKKAGISEKGFADRLLNGTGLSTSSSTLFETTASRFDRLRREFQLSTSNVLWSFQEAEKVQNDLVSIQTEEEEKRLKRIEKLQYMIAQTNYAINSSSLKGNDKAIAEQIILLNEYQNELNTLQGGIDPNAPNRTNTNVSPSTATKSEIDKAKKELERLSGEINKVIQESARLGSEALEDEFDRQQNVLLTKYSQDVEELTKLRSQILTSSLPEALKKEGLQAIDASIDYLGTIAYRESVALWEKNEEAKAKILQEGLKTHFALLEDNLALELLAIEEQRKKEAKVLEDAGLDAEIATEIANKKINDVNQKYDLIRIQREEELAKQSVDLIRTAGLSEEEATKIKSEAILRIEQEANKKRLELILKNNKLNETITQEAIEKYRDYVTSQNAKGESAVSIFDLLKIDTSKLSEEDKLNIQKLLSLIGKDINDKKGKSKDSKSFFGDLFNLSDDELKAVNDSIALGVNAYNDILSAQEDAINREMALIDKKIAKIQEEIDAQRNRVDEEKRLAEEGYANNYEVEQQRLADLEAREQEELKIKEETSEKMMELQKRQLILDYATSTATMIASSALTIKSAIEQMGWVGAIFGVATAGAMVAGFIKLQNQIKTITEAPSFRKGGTFDILSGGASHEEGGIGLYDDKSGKKLAEFEGDEKLFIVNKGSSKKHASLLEAINNDDFKAIQSLVLDNDLVDGNIKDSMYVVNKEYELNTASVNIDNESIADLRRSNRAMYELLLNQSQIIDMGDYYVEISGNTRREIRKNK